MPRYRLTWTETLAGFVDAESESAARQAWIDGDVDHYEETSMDLFNVEEISPC